MTAPRLALIGCGAIAERFHAPALRRRPATLAGLVLVDPDRRRAEALAAACGAGRIVADYREALGAVDGAIITVPHDLHFPIARDCLAAGIPVLCEKPLAGTAPEARALVAAAAERGVQLAVNNTRRLYASHRRVAELVGEGTLGVLRRLEFEDGDRFDWPLASGALFGSRGGGRGLLLDIGSHVLDLVCWWLGGLPDVTGYEDDAMGGTEAALAVDLRRGDCSARVRLSWLSKLRNGFVLEGDRGRVEGGIYDWRSLTLSTGRRTRRLTLASAARVYADFGVTMLDNFLSVIERGERPLVSGADVLPSMELIDTCYARRRRSAMPWFDAYSRRAL